MSLCRSCGSKIHWIELKSGKMHPCDLELIASSDAVDGDRFVTEEGEIVVVRDSMKQEFSGYVSHFSTCPDAENWRSKK